MPFGGEILSRGIYIIGTDTEVGKTVVSAGLLHLLIKNNIRAAYFKPVASGEVEVEGRPTPADAAFVQAVSGFAEDIQDVTPFSFSDEVAPHLAARLAQRPIDQQRIVEALDALKKKYEVIIGEAAGGLAVPLDDDGFFMQYDLIRSLDFSCLLVARAGLGTINHTLLTLRAARGAGLRVKGIVVNGSGGSLLEQDNIAMIQKLGGLDDVFVLPAITPFCTAPPSALHRAYENAFNIEKLLSLMDPL